jgi:ATP-binding cassette subfamily B protein
MPLLGQELAQLAAQYPAYRNITLRLLEPIAAPHRDADDANAGTFAAVGAVCLDFCGVGVRVGGHMVLDAIDLHIEPGSHVAVVGLSGAGKSTLLGLLLGWHLPATGQIRVDGSPLGAAALERLRGCTAWIDPAISLWNRSIVENVEYGWEDTAKAATGRVMEVAGAYEIVARLRDGLQTTVGEGGRSLSGGEAQRLRIARALGRRNARLVLLDEPFRGIESSHRADLLAAVREQWTKATLLCVTHNIAEAITFDRVVVLQGGRIVEDGNPRDLLARDESVLQSLVGAEADLDKRLHSAHWRAAQLRRGNTDWAPVAPRD